MDGLKISMTISKAELKDAIKDIEKYKAKKQKKIQDLVSFVTLLLESEAKKRAPVDTGRLRSSIISIIEDLTGTVGTNVEYAEFVEFGTKNMTAQAFLIPAYEDVRVKFIADIKKLLRKEER